MVRKNVAALVETAEILGDFTKERSTMERAADLQRQNSRNPLRCNPMKVLGFTTVRAKMARMMSLRSRIALHENSAYQYASIAFSMDLPVESRS